MTPWVTRLIIANVAVFFLTVAVPILPVRPLVLVPAYILFRPWTLVTYMFLHAGLWHIVFNMIALFFFGPRLEGRLGSRHFLALYFVSGLTGALLSIPFSPFAQIVGASGAVYGVLLGFARYWPRERIYIWGVLPIEARVLVIIMTVLSLWGGLGGRGAGVAHFAHLGGFLGGFVYLKWREMRSPAARFKAKATPFAKRKPPAQSEVAGWKQIRRDGLHPINRAELDRILDKISATGVSSLTADERAFLERFRPDD
jgi:membrane associated rhomboid family serine protease